MTMTTAQFLPIWRRMLQSWPGSRIEPGTPEAYARRLAPFEAGEVLAVVQELETEAEYLPSIATLWQRCLAVRDGAPIWEDAWLEAQDHAESDEAFPWSHEAVRAAARAVGGLGLHEIHDNANPAALRAQFRDAYLSMLNQQHREYASGARALPPPAPSAGVLESSNGRRAITAGGGGA